MNSGVRLHSLAKRLFGTLLGFVLFMPWAVFPATVPEDGRPSRVVSINLCTDQLLLLLAEPGQIASVSHLSREPESSFMAEAASRYPVNRAGIEELLVLDPDLILAGEFSPSALIKLLRRLGYRVEILPLASSLEDIRHNLRRVAGMLGAVSRGERLIAEMDQRIGRVVGKPHHTRPKALFYQPRGYTSGRNTLQDEALELAGWRNLAAEQGIDGYASIDLESLILARPERFFTSGYAPGTRSLAQRLLNHPALRRLNGGKPMINIDYRYWICGGPMIAEAIEALDAAHPR